jgi:hypothetical protein
MKAGPKLKPFCKRGHEMIPENLYIAPNGRRRCVACHKLLMKDRPKTMLQSMPEYMAYCSAKSRCNHVGNRAYPSYGGRGIRFNFVSFEEFLRELGLRPSPKHSLDRINNDGNYEIGNVRWATAKEQLYNRRPYVLSSFSDSDLLAEVKRRNLCPQ